jgi:hypothetical protein
MKTLAKLTKDERSLLLYFESRSIDYYGRVDPRQMNDEDREIAERWNKEKFVLYGRIASDWVNEYGSEWCRLSDEAMKLAAEERKARANRMWKKRPWKSTQELNGTKISFS